MTYVKGPLGNGRWPVVVRGICHCGAAGFRGGASRAMRIFQNDELTGAHGQQAESEKTHKKERKKKKKKKKKNLPARLRWHHRATAPLESPRAKDRGCSRRHRKVYKLITVSWQ